MYESTNNPHIIDEVKQGRSVLWINPELTSATKAQENLPVSREDVIKAERNWTRLAPLLEELFPELAETQGIIESDLIEANVLRKALGLTESAGKVLLKADHGLPIAGSIKARGGIYEVCMHAWSLAIQAGLLKQDDNPRILANAECQAFFSNYSIAVGSTGNLGLSVGITARAFGFEAVVHMSSDAKAWKIKRLENLGVQVVQHDGDYGAAVDTARRHAERDELTYFVDDERSELLFFGYSAAAIRLKQQLGAAGVLVDKDHPLFLYLPCGIGGAPGGIAYGSKQIFGDNVHCFFVEPVQAPCALVQFLQGVGSPVSVYDFGLNNETEADGLAVPAVSQFVAQIMRNLLSGVLTVKDDDLYRWLYMAKKTEDIQLEPSAASCFAGPVQLTQSKTGRAYLQEIGMDPDGGNITHILWTTGGRFVPDDRFEAFMARGKMLSGEKTDG